MKRKRKSDLSSLQNVPTNTNPIDVNSIAIGMIASISMDNVALSYLSPKAIKYKQPFLSKSVFIANHVDALKIIEELQDFYERYSEDDIDNINDQIKKLIEKTK